MISANMSAQKISKFFSAERGAAHDAPSKGL